MFAQATKHKFRFPTPKGPASVEDLWDLSVEDLDATFKSLNRDLKVVSEESLLSKKTSADEILGVKIEIVKHIVTVKQAMAEDRANARARREKKARLQELLAQKQDEALTAKSAEELQKLIDDLGD